MKYTIKYFGETNIGCCRIENQDNFICQGVYMKADMPGDSYAVNGEFSNKETAVLGVFDGIGGEEHGEIASMLAAEAACEIQLHAGTPAEQLKKYCRRANRKICEFAATHEISAMGTTAAMLAFTEREILLFNIGDTKIFHVSGHKLKQISEDHYAISAYGKKPPLSQNLGIPETELILEPFLARGIYKDEDMFLICSDGLTDMVEQEEIEKIIAETEFEETVHALVEKAIENGGRDNITVILCKIKEKDSFFRKLFSKM